MRHKEQIVDGFNMIIGLLRSSRGDPDAWEASIRKFEFQDRAHPLRQGEIVFVGSSSFALWARMEQDMAPLPVLNRGFGGSRIRDVVHYADRIVLPHRPKAVVLYAGTNDISWPRPADAKQVFEGYLAFVRQINEALPETSIYYVSISPAPSRWRYWPIVQEANHLIQEHTQTDPRLHFIDLTSAILGPDGKPDRSLFRFDGLHPNRRGYARWTAVIKPVLEAATN